MEVKPLAFDSFGVRSMATYLQTDDVGILIDPGVSLTPYRYGLPPHQLEWKRLEECWNMIKEYAKVSDILVVTHYHYDHHDPTEPEIYGNKIVYLKHPTMKINRSQMGRASHFLSLLRNFPKKLEYADGREISSGKTRIRFSHPVCHGTNPRLGYVVQVSVSDGDQKFLFTSDVEGPSLDDQVAFILEEKPDILILDGPMTYMLGFRYSYKSLQISNQNIVKIIENTPLRVLMPEHHLMRDLRYKTKISPVYATAMARGVKVVSAAEYVGREVEMLEARRKELFVRP